MKILHFAFLVTAASVVLQGAASCGSDTESNATTAGGTGGEPENPELADVVYAGGTTDEALEQLLAATPKDSPNAATLTSPTDGASVPKSPALTFKWNATASLAPSRSGARTVRWYGSWDRPPSPVKAALQPLIELLGPIRSAHAHGAPLNGTAYFLVLSTSKDDKLVRVFTTGTTFAPDAATWAKITGAGEEITADLTTAIFENNLLAADGGPFGASPVKFTIAP